MNNINTENLTDNPTTESKMIRKFFGFFHEFGESPRTHTPSLAARWLDIPYGKEHAILSNIEESIVIKNYLEYKRNFEVFKTPTTDTKVRAFIDQLEIFTEIAFKTLLPEVIKSQIPDTFANKAEFIKNLDIFLDPHTPNIYLSIEKGNEVMCFLSTLLPFHLQQYLAHTMPEIAHWSETMYYKLIMTTNNEAATMLEPNSTEFDSHLKEMASVPELQRYKDLNDMYVKKATALRANLSYAKGYLKSYIGFHTEKSGYNELFNLINNTEAYLDKANLKWNEYMDKNYYAKYEAQISQSLPPTQEHKAVPELPASEMKQPISLGGERVLAARSMDQILQNLVTVEP